eukprot:116796-Chlamydomonas_euryale.AAC.4
MLNGSRQHVMKNFSSPVASANSLRALCHLVTSVYNPHGSPGRYLAVQRTARRWPKGCQMCACTLGPTLGARRGTELCASVSQMDQSLPNAACTPGSQPDRVRTCFLV